MRIVIDATAAVSGGKVYLNQLLTQFARMNGEDTFTIFHTGDFDDFTLPGSSDRFEFNRISMPVFSGRNWIGSSIVKMLWRLFVLPSHLNRIKPDLLFSNAGFVSGRMISGVKTVLALHNSMPLRSELIAEEKSLPGKLRLIFLKILMGRALASSDGAIVFSHDTRDRVIDTFKHNTKPLFVVYHGIDWGVSEREMKTFTPMPAITKLPGDYLLYVSQLHRYKNIPRLIRAFALIADQFKDLKLVLVGEKADPDYWREIEAEIQTLNLKDRVVHVPACPREELIAVYRNAAAFVHPSLAETCSFPLLEALAMGLPIAAANLSALPEMAADAAIYFDPYNPEDIADKLRLIVGNQDLRNSLSLKAVKRAQDFSWQHTASQTLKVFESICRH